MNPSKVIKHWRLVAVTELIAQHLASLKGIVLQAMRRKANSLADHLANHAVDYPDDAQDMWWQDLMLGTLRDQCHVISRQELTVDTIVGTDDSLSLISIS